jgi:chlorobactene glucosyltransferase
MLLWLYILVGPGAWLLAIVLAQFARFRMGRLNASKATLPIPAPSLSIVVPAKDEAAGIASCIDHIRQQDYPQFTLTVINDRSTDGTREILDQLQQTSSSASASRLNVVHINDLPANWLGKCHALHVGTRTLTTDWILFVDSDVKLAPDAARRAVAMCVDRDWHALSILTKLKPQSFWERTLLPLLAASWSAAFTISLTNDDSKPHIAAANGQFFLIRRDWYEKVGNHESVRTQIVEDVMLMRTLKQAGAKTRLQLGQSLASTQMHATLRHIFHGWARIFAGTSGRSPWRMIGIMLFLVVCTLSVIPALAMSRDSSAWAIASWTHLALIVGLTSYIYRASGQGVVNVLLLPLAIPMQLAVLAYSVWVCFSGRVSWRGNRVEVK